MKKPILIYAVRAYTNKVNGKQMFAFNDGQFHLSYPQLQNADCDVPQLLQGTTMIVEFFAKGEALLGKNADGTQRICTEDEKIVKNFTPEIDKELYRQVALGAVQAKLDNWQKAAMRPRVNLSGAVAPTASTNEQSAMIANGGGPNITRNSQLTQAGDPIEGAGYDEEGNLIATTGEVVGASTSGAQAATAAQIGG